MADLTYVETAIPAKPRRRRVRRQISDMFAISVAHMIAVTALVFTLPLMIVIATAIVLQDGGPALFRHRRIGRHGKRFYCLKFRTMVVGAEQQLAGLLASSEQLQQEWAEAHKLRRDPRVTPLGRFLRRSSLDELPQLFNLLRGDMSLVGPRPIVDDEIERYGWRFRHYTAVKPGITGLWQVSGRNDTSYRARVAMDCLYTRRKCASLDAWLLMRTPWAVLRRRGSY